MTFFEELRNKKEEEFKQNTGLNLWELTDIEAHIASNTIETFVYSRDKAYFDDSNLYIIADSTVLASYELNSIKELTRTSYISNDKRIWKLVIDDTYKKQEFKLIPFKNLTTVNFSLFLDKVAENEDSLVNSEFIF
ncbi:hypothetical protein [Flavobacterium sp.]|uniref:hypothetical protein n=1 Tax=Flavobacterium sp. TaxID=239 RepID=UPI003D124107